MVNHVVQEAARQASNVDPIVTNIVALGVLGGFGATFVLPKFARHLVHSLFLIGLGLIPVLYELYVIDFQIPDFAIITYVVTAIIMLTGGTLLKDGFHEGGTFGYTAMVFGIIIMLNVLIPTMYKINAITFDVPSYPPIINSVLYLVSGIMLLISTFILGE
jgi:hypothetical protein